MSDCNEDCRKLDIDKLEEMYYEEIMEKLEEIDPSSSEDWYSLTLGWAIGKGLTPEDSHDFSRHIRYHTDMG